MVTFDSPEVQEAAEALAHREVWDREGRRDQGAERRLLKFGTNEAERKHIQEVLRASRAKAVSRAMTDPAWRMRDGPGEPKAETDGEFRNRRMRSRVIAFLAAVILVTMTVIVIGRWSAADTQLLLTVEAGNSGSVESVEVQRPNGVKIMTPNGDDPILTTGVVLDERKMGDVPGQYRVVVKGKGPLRCIVYGNHSGLMDRDQAIGTVACEGRLKS